MKRELKALGLFCLLGLVAIFSMGAAPSSVVFDAKGTSRMAKPLFTGHCILGDAQGDTLDLNLGFVPTIFVCWVSDSAKAGSAAQRYTWFTGMTNGTAYTTGVTAPDTIISGGVTPMAAAAADTVKPYNYSLTPATTATKGGASANIKITGVRLGASLTGNQVTDVLYWYAIP